MKFQIKRTSHGWNQQERPCEHPTLKDETLEADRVGDPEDYQHVWTIQISDLAELLALSGSTVRSRPWPNRILVGSAETGDRALPTIEIYDTYRE